MQLEFFKSRMFQYVFVALLLMTGCKRDESVSPPTEPPDLSHLQLTMHKVGGFGGTHQQWEVYSSGWVMMKLLGAETSDTVQMTLSEQQSWKKLIDAFPNFEREYVPNIIIVDGFGYSLIDVSRQQPDTTSLYDLNRVFIPLELRVGILTLEKVWSRGK